MSRGWGQVRGRGDAVLLSRQERHCDAGPRPNNAPLSLCTHHLHYCSSAPSSFCSTSHSLSKRINMWGCVFPQSWGCWWTARTTCWASAPDLMNVWLYVCTTTQLPVSPAPGFFINLNLSSTTEHNTDLPLSELLMLYMFIIDGVFSGGVVTGYIMFKCFLMCCPIMLYWNHFIKDFPSSCVEALKS